MQLHNKNAQVKKRSNYLCHTNQYFLNIEGCQQGKANKKKYFAQNPIKKWNNFLYGHKKIDSKYFEVKIENHRALHLVYRKLDTKFEQFWCHKSRLKVRLKLIGSKWCSNLLHIKILMYYDYKIHNLIIHKYFLGLH